MRSNSLPLAAAHAREVRDEFGEGRPRAPGKVGRDGQCKMACVQNA